MCGEIYTFSFYFYFHYCKNNISSFFFKLQTSIKKHPRKIKTFHGNSRVLSMAQSPFGGSVSKEPACNAGDLGSIPGLGRSPWRRKWQPTPVFLPGKFHGQRSLAGYNPWGHKESDTAERLTLWLFMVTHIYSWIYIITIVKEFLPDTC